MTWDNGSDVPPHPHSLEENLARVRRRARAIRGRRMASAALPLLAIVVTLVGIRGSGLPGYGRLADDALVRGSSQADPTPGFTTPEPWPSHTPYRPPTPPAYGYPTPPAQHDSEPEADDDADPSRTPSPSRAPSPLGPRGWYGAEGCIATSSGSSFSGGPYPPECTYTATQPGGYHANTFEGGPWEIRIERGDDVIVYRSGESDVCTYVPVIKAGDRVTATTKVAGAGPDHPADVSVGAAVSCSGRPPGDDPEPE